MIDWLIRSGPLAQARDRPARSETIGRPIRMKPQPELATQEVLAGLVERVTFHNAENGFCVLRAKARGHRDQVTVVGHAATISAGEWITASGEWVNDRTHGQQFKARFLKTSAPTSIDGIEKYLGSGMIRGIGPDYAKKLVRAFGEKVFDTIEAEPGRLREVTGIGPVRAGRITAAWAEQKIVREIMVFLHSNGVGTARAVRIYKTYGADAVQVMSENPYRLARDIRGIGFKTADAIAMKLGVDKSAMIRVRAGISYALTEAMDEGHCGLPTAELTPLAEKLLDVPQDLILTALDLELGDGTVIADRLGETACVFLAGLYRAERAIAERLLTLNRGTLPWAWIDPGKAIPWIERRTGLTLAESQKAAVGMALGSKVLVITGGPGVGKTTIVNAILSILSAKDMRLLLCAPTGRAAKRMNEATGLEAKTIHRLLEAKGLGSFPLGIERVEVLFEAVLGGFTGVDGTAEVFSLVRTGRTLTESQSAVLRRNDSGGGDSGTLRTGVGRSHDRRGCDSAAMGGGGFDARRAGAAVVGGGGGSECGLGRSRGRLEDHRACPFDHQSWRR